MNIFKKTLGATVIAGLLLTSCTKEPSNEPIVKEVTLSQSSTVPASSTSIGELKLSDLDYKPLEAASAKGIPAKNSLDKVILAEFIDFGCGYCYRFNGILYSLKSTYRDKLQVETIVISWRGENLPKFYYFAEKNGKGGEVQSMLFGMFHDSNVKNINNMDILKVVGEEIGLIKSGDNLEELINTPDIIEKFNKNEARLREYKVTGTPTVVVEESMIAAWDKENLTKMFNYLLK